MDNDTQKAISAALNRDWKIATATNLKLLKKEPKNIDALCRLARAYFETGLKTKAEDIYKKVLRLDKFNSIAAKNLGLLRTSRIPRTHSSKVLASIPPPMFLEEPGITKTVTLIRLGDPKVISRLHPGDSVFVTAREHIVSIISTDSLYVGRLPDDLTSRLLPLLRAGNKYHTWIRSLTDGVKVFIKEMSRSPGYASTPSFPITEKLSYSAFTPPELVHTEKPDVSETETQEDFTSTDREQDLEDASPEPLPREDL